MARPKTIEDSEILRVARDVFVAAGAQGSTREIARRLNIAEASLFKRYPTKVALFLAAMTPPTPDTTALLAAARAEPDMQKALHVIGTFTLQYFRQAIPQMLPLITHPGIGLEQLLREFGESPATSFHAAIGALLSERQQQGDIAPGEPLATAGLIVAALHSVALFELTGIHGGAVPDAVLRAMLDALWHGLRPAGPAPPSQATATDPPAAKRAPAHRTRRTSSPRSQ